MTSLSPLQLSDQDNGVEAREKKGKPKKEEKPKKEKTPKQKSETAISGGGVVVKKDSQMGLSAKKDDNFSAWYSQVVTHGEMIEYYDVFGCYILRPWSYSIWEHIVAFFDAEIKKLGVKNAYFPLFVSEKALAKEKDHVEGFAPEVAWVTRSGNSELEEPIAVRPTSETVMSREFLWQEGHSAFATKADADEEVYAILKLYKRVYEELLAVPVSKGIKSEVEKFAGGIYTTTVEAFISNTGRGIQAATSHCLGQNFSKMFEIWFENDNRERKLVWQNSWGLSTRAIGVMIMVHGDDRGLVLPPRVAPVQVVIIHIPSKDIDTKVLLEACQKVAQDLRDVGIRVEEDYRDNYKPGWKFCNWELKGVPVRVEIGSKDVAGKKVTVVRRDNGLKSFLSIDNIGADVKALLEDVQQTMLNKARVERESCIIKVTTWEEFMAALNKKKMALAPWCDEAAVEEDVKEKTESDLNGAAKTLCMPLEQPDLPEGLSLSPFALRHIYRWGHGEEPRVPILWYKNWHQLNYVVHAALLIGDAKGLYVLLQESLQKGGHCGGEVIDLGAKLLSRFWGHKWPPSNAKKGAETISIWKGAETISMTDLWETDNT